MSEGAAEGICCWGAGTNTEGPGTTTAASGAGATTTAPSLPDGETASDCRGDGAAEGACGALNDWSVEGWEAGGRADGAVTAAPPEGAEGIVIGSVPGAAGLVLEGSSNSGGGLVPVRGLRSGPPGGSVSALPDGAV